MSVTCQVGILSFVREGALYFRAYPLECKQDTPWRRTQLDAEADALRMDGHVCPSQSSGNHARLIPFDRPVTTTQALYAPASALRYVPSRE
jgi:hypothetical protein